MQPIYRSALEGHRVVLPSLVDPVTCRSWSALADATVSATAAAYPPGYRDNDRAVRWDPELAEALWERVRPHLPARAVDAHGREWVPVAMNPQLRFCRYAGGQRFVRHRDGAWFGEGERSFWTFQLYLDEGFSGGETRFWAPDARVEPRTGTGLVFDHREWHAGEPVVDGVKHVLRSDVVFRPRSPRPEVGHRGYVWRLAVDGHSVLSAGRDGTVRRWDAEGREAFVWRGPTRSLGPLMARDGGWVAGTRDGLLVDAAGAAHRAHAGAVLDVCALDDGLVTAGADGFVRAWSAGHSLRWEARVHAGWVWRLWVDGADVWSVGEDGVLARTAGGRPRVVLRGAVPLTAVHDGVTGDAEGWVSRIDGTRLHRHEGRVRAVLQRGGTVWSAGEDDRVRTPGGVVRRHGDFATDVVWGPGGPWSCGYDGRVGPV